MRGRSEYRLQNSGRVALLSPDPRIRPVDVGDRAGLATLLLDAYRGTVDDEGEGEAEALQAVDFSLAVLDPRYSVVMEEADELLAMSFVVWVNERCYIDPVATAARLKRCGLGRLVVQHSIGQLAADGIHEVRAAITDGNEPSTRLFTGLGFERVGPWPPTGVA